MATRSTIGIKREDGTIDFIYCHWDGYLEGVGKTLKENYTNEQKIHQLISLGSVSSLGDEIFPKSNHSFDSPEKNVTVFYGRDRGEKDVDYTKVNSFDEYKQHFEEFNYLWEDSVWKYCCSSDKQFIEFNV